jgi:hypothetical protein
MAGLDPAIYFVVVECSENVDAGTSRAWRSFG